MTSSMDRLAGAGFFLPEIMWIQTVSRPPLLASDNPSTRSGLMDMVPILTKRLCMSVLLLRSAGLGVQKTLEVNPDARRVAQLADLGVAAISPAVDNDLLAEVVQSPSVLGRLPHLLVF